MAQAKVVIKGYNELSSPVKQAKSEVSSFGQVAEKVGNQLKNAFAITAIIATVRKLGQSLGECLSEFNKVERAYKQMSLALGDTKGFDKLTESIKELSRETLSSKDDVEAMVSELAALGKSADEIDSISHAAVYLSNVTGKDLNSSMTTLLNTYNGTTKSLNKLGIDTSNLTQEELEQGAAVQIVIDKFGDLSKAMSENDTSQTIKNIKDSLGDMRQSIGDLVNAVIGPALQQIDQGLLTIKGKFDTFVQNVKIIIQNFPEVMSHLWDAIKKGLANLFSYEGLKQFFSNILNYSVTTFKAMGNNVANLANGVFGIVERLWNGLKSYSMYMITKICDDVGINITEVINSIGEWLTTSPIGKVIDQILSKLINGIRLVGNIIKNIPSIVKIVVNNIGTILSTLFQNIPKAIGQIFVGLGHRVAEFALKIKNDIAQAIEDTINGIGEKISDTWLGRWLGLGKGMRDFDIGVDRTSEYNQAAKADEAFGNAKNYMGNIGEDLAPMMKEIQELLDPAFEKWTADNATTLGQTMAKWTAKSSDEYYQAAKDSFSDIGTFLSDWGSTFMGDLKDGWSETTGAFTQIFEDSFGGSFDEFLDWFRPFMETKMLEAAEGKSNLSIGVNTGSSGGENPKEEEDEVSDGKKIFDSAMTDLSSSLGEAGTLMGEMVKNMTTMGPIIGLIVTALKYVIQGFAELISGPLNEFVKYGIEPLREIGRVIASILLPILKDIMPSIKQSAEFLIGVFDMLSSVLRPIVSFISSFLTPILSGIVVILQILEVPLKIVAKGLSAVGETLGWLGDWIRHIVASIVNWLASWIPWIGYAEDPGRPGNLGTRIQNSWNNIDNAFNGTGLAGNTLETSTATATQNATYTGAMSVTINIFQQAPVVGEGGMMEFAQMIRAQFENLAYYSV